MNRIMIKVAKDILAEKKLQAKLKEACEKDKSHTERLAE